MFEENKIDFSTRFALIFTGFFISIMIVPGFICTCGHLGVTPLWINLIIANLVWYPLYKGNSIKYAFIAISPIILQSMITLKTLNAGLTA